jgi:NAD-dependent dihydropyrimidine dehydrogenase PreA subunit
MGGGRRGMRHGMHRRRGIAKRSGIGGVGTPYPGASPRALITSQKMHLQVLAEEELATLKGQARAIEDQPLAARARITESDQSRGVFPVVAVADRDKCIACGACQEICPTGAIFIDEIARIDPANCTGCGQCVAQCPQEAIYLQKV